jgi:hypothetical protein
MYDSEAAMENGIRSVMTNGPTQAISEASCVRQIVREARGQSPARCATGRPRIVREHYVQSSSAADQLRTNRIGSAGASSATIMRKRPLAETSYCALANSPAVNT